MGYLRGYLMGACRGGKFFWRINEHITVAQLVLFAHQQVSEELFQESGVTLNPLGYILVIGPYKRIPEIPRMHGKQVIGNVEPDGRQILNGENNCRSRVPFSERMYLPDARHNL